MLAQETEANPSDLNANQSRMAAVLVAGVGFLGAGVILRTDDRVRGLPIAAGI